MSNTSGDRNGKAPARSPLSKIWSLFKKKTTKKRSGLGSSSTHVNYDDGWFIQICRKRKATIEYQGRRCTREQVLHILESKLYGVELIDLYAEVILNKVVVDGKDRASYEILPADTFMKYKGYIGGSGNLKTQFYMEMMADKVNDSQIDKIFVPINQGDHWHLLTVNFDGCTMTHYNSRKNQAKHYREFLRVAGWMNAYLTLRFDKFEDKDWQKIVEPRFTQVKCKDDDNGLRMLLAIEALALGHVGYGIDKDLNAAKWSLLDGIRMMTTFDD